MAKFQFIPLHDGRVRIDRVLENSSGREYVKVTDDLRRANNSCTNEDQIKAGWM